MNANVSQQTPADRHSLRVVTDLTWADLRPGDLLGSFSLATDDPRLVWEMFLVIRSSPSSWDPGDLQVSLLCLYQHLQLRQYVGGVGQVEHIVRAGTAPIDPTHWWIRQRDQATCKPTT